MSRTARTLWIAALVAPLALGLAAPRALADEAPGGDAFAAGERFYQRGIKHMRTRRYDKAVEMFEKALPTRNQGSDIFYNLVGAAEAAQLWGKAILYAQGFLFLESDTADARDIRRKLKRARAEATKLQQGAVEVSFALEPAGAEVHVAQVPLARSGGAPVWLVPGTYAVVARKPEHDPFQTSVTVADGKPLKVEGALARQLYYGSLVIKSEPAEGVQVFLDDKLVGTTPLEPLKLETRRYLVRFEKAGWDMWHRYVTVERDKTATLEPALERSVGGGR